MTVDLHTLRARVEAAQALAARATRKPWKLFPDDGDDEWIIARKRAKNGPVTTHMGVVAELRNTSKATATLLAAASDLVTLATDLLAELEWQDERHGTRAEQEAEEAADDAEWAEIEAMPKEQIRAELAAEGIDPDEADRKGSVFVRALIRRNSAVAAADRLTVERDEARAELEREQALQCEAVKTADNLREELGATLSGSVREALRLPASTPWADVLARARSLAERDPGRTLDDEGLGGGDGGGR